MCKQLGHLRLIDGILHRVTKIDDEDKYQFVLRTEYVNYKTVLQTLHDDMGPPGKDRTTSLVRDSFYRPGMHNGMRHRYKNVAGV